MNWVWGCSIGNSSSYRSIFKESRFNRWIKQELNIDPDNFETGIVFNLGDMNSRSDKLL